MFDTDLFKMLIISGFLESADVDIEVKSKILKNAALKWNELNGPDIAPREIGSIQKMIEQVNSPQKQNRP